MYADAYIMPIRPIIRDLEQQASEAEWEGNKGRADRLMVVVERKRKLLAQGQEFEVLF